MARRETPSAAALGLTGARAAQDLEDLGWDDTALLRALGSAGDPNLALNTAVRLAAALGDGYERVLGASLARPFVIIAVTAVLGAAGYLLYGRAGTGFLPEMDEGSFVFDYFAPGGTALAETDRQVHVAERLMLRTPEVQGISRRTGAELGLAATQQNRGDMVVRLVPRAQRSRTVFQIMDQLRAEMSAALGL